MMKALKLVQKIWRKVMPKANPEQRQKIIELHNQGVSTMEIMKRLGVHRARIYSVLHPGKQIEYSRTYYWKKKLLDG